MNSERATPPTTPQARPWPRRTPAAAPAALLTALAFCLAFAGAARAQTGQDSEVPVGGSRLKEPLSAARQREVLKKVAEDGGGPFPEDASVYAVRRKGGRRVYVIQYQTENPCGRRYDIYRKTAGRYEALLSLECVRGLYLTYGTYGYTFTRGHPDFTYVTGDKPERYYAVFKFADDHGRYTEKVCKAEGPGGLTVVECSGRGVVVR